MNLPVESPSALGGTATPVPSLPDDHNLRRGDQSAGAKTSPRNARVTPTFRSAPYLKKVVPAQGRTRPRPTPDPEAARHHSKKHSFTWDGRRERDQTPEFVGFPRGDRPTSTRPARGLKLLPCTPPAYGRAHTETKREGSPAASGARLRNQNPRRETARRFRGSGAPLHRPVPVFLRAGP